MNAPSICSTVFFPAKSKARVAIMCCATTHPPRLLRRRCRRGRSQQAARTRRDRCQASLWRARRRPYRQSGAVENQIVGQMVQATSRVLKEEVIFDNSNVTRQASAIL